jgi:hypothetical protein
MKNKTEAPGTRILRVFKNIAAKKLLADKKSPVLGKKMQETTPLQELRGKIREIIARLDKQYNFHAEEISYIASKLDLIDQKNYLQIFVDDLEILEASLEQLKNAQDTIEKVKQEYGLTSSELDLNGIDFSVPGVVNEAVDVFGSNIHAAVQLKQNQNKSLKEENNLVCMPIAQSMDGVYKQKTIQDFFDPKTNALWNLINENNAVAYSDAQAVARNVEKIRQQIRQTIEKDMQNNKFFASDNSGNDDVAMEQKNPEKDLLQLDKQREELEKGIKEQEKLLEEQQKQVEKQLFLPFGRRRAIELAVKKFQMDPSVAEDSAISQLLNEAREYDAKQQQLQQLPKEIELRIQTLQQQKQELEKHIESITLRDIYCERVVKEVGAPIFWLLADVERRIIQNIQEKQQLYAQGRVREKDLTHLEIHALHNNEINNKIEKYDYQKGVQECKKAMQEVIKSNEIEIQKNEPLINQEKVENVKDTIVNGINAFKRANLATSECLRETIRKDLNNQNLREYIAEQEEKKKSTPQKISETLVKIGKIFNKAANNLWNMANNYFFAKKGEAKVSPPEKDAEVLPLPQPQTTEGKPSSGIQKKPPRPTPITPADSTIAKPGNIPFNKSVDGSLPRGGVRLPSAPVEDMAPVKGTISVKGTTPVAVTAKDAAQSLNILMNVLLNSSSSSSSTLVPRAFAAVSGIGDSSFQQQNPKIIFEEDIYLDDDLKKYRYCRLLSSSPLIFLAMSWSKWNNLLMIWEWFFLGDCGICKKEG